MMKPLYSAGLCLVMVMMLVACSADTPATPTPEATPRALVGTLTTIAQSELLDAPAMAVQDGTMMLAWRGRDETGSRHLAQSAEQSEATILALDARLPYEYRLFPASDDRFHLLWLDRTANSTTLRLRVALINRAAVAELGANDVSRQQVYSYDAVPDNRGRVHLIWNSNLPDEPTLYSTYIDSEGRIALPALLQQNGHHPALSIEPDGTQHIYWQRDNSIWYGRLEQSELEDIQPITECPRPQSRRSSDCGQGGAG